MRKLFFIILFTLYSIYTFAQTGGELTVTVKTSATGGNYAPRNIVAIWIENSSGTFIKTLLAYGDKRKTYLNNWEASTTKAGSAFNNTDAISGATQSSHGTRNCTWNGKDYKGNLVNDGNYKLCMELTDKNSTGNYSNFEITKSTNEQNTNPSDVASFSSIKMKWSPTPIQIPIQITRNVSICSGENFTYPDLSIDTNITKNTSHISNLKSKSGGDSIVTTNLTVNPIYKTKEDVTICLGASYKGWTEKGEYTENLKAVTGCDSIVTTNLTVETTEKPVITQNNSMLLSSFETGNQWYFNNTEISGAKGQSLLLENEGNYTVIATSNYGCVSPMSDVFIFQMTSVLGVEYELKMFPNPTSGLIQIEGLPLNETTTIDIINGTGQKIITREISGSNTTIDLSNQIDGVYLIAINRHNSKSIMLFKK